MPRIGALAPHGAITPLSGVATATLAACCTALDADGTICAVVPELARRAGQGLRTTERGLAELVAAGLVHASGSTRATYRYVDARVRKALQMPISKRTGDAGWRELRARCGGFERAMRAAQRQAQDALALVQRASEGSTTLANGAGDAAIDAHLRAASLHALACVDGPEGCVRCASLHAVLVDGSRGELAQAAQDHLEEADELHAAAVAVVEAFRASGVGTRQAQAAALQTLERMVRA